MNTLEYEKNMDTNRRMEMMMCCCMCNMPTAQFCMCMRI